MNAIDRTRVILAVSLLSALVVSVGVVGQSAQPAAGGPDDPRFTGISRVLDSKDLSAARRDFEPGARTAWHSHAGGQLLFVESGHLRIGKRGQPFKDFGPGESDYTGPNVEHWHGAVPNERVVQLYLMFAGETKWLEKVSDAEYLGRR
jgi:quercetin dioxygenase-like cupin family protein